MYGDWKHKKEDEKYYGVTAPYEPTPIPASQTMPAIEPLPPVEDFLPEFEVQEAEVAEPSTIRGGQPSIGEHHLNALSGSCAGPRSSQ
jgi:hypothetical protein